MLNEIRANPVFARLTARRRKLFLSVLIMVCVVVALFAIATGIQSQGRRNDSLLSLLSLLITGALLISPLISGILTAIATASDTSSEAYTLQLLSNIPASKVMEGYYWAAVVRLDWLWVIVGGLLSLLCYISFMLTINDCWLYLTCSDPVIIWATALIGMIIIVVATHRLAVLMAVGAAISSRKVLGALDTTITSLVIALFMIGLFVIGGTGAVIMSPLCPGPLWIVIGAYIANSAARTERDILVYIRRQMHTGA
jgi:hypothetical protein